MQYFVDRGEKFKRILRRKKQKIMTINTHRNRIGEEGGAAAGDDDAAGAGTPSSSSSSSAASSAAPTAGGTLDYSGKNAALIPAAVWDSVGSGTLFIDSL